VTGDADLLHVPAGAGALHVERYGRGASVIVLLHGFATHSIVWRNIAPPLAESGATVFAVDLLGYGQSDRPAGAEYGIAAQARCVERALTSLRIRRAMVVGLDIGATIAARLAATDPQRVERLVLVAPAGPDEIPGKEVREMQRRTLRVVLRMSSSVMGAAPLLTPLLRRAVARPERMPTALLAQYLAPYAGREGALHLLLLARALHKRDIADVNLRGVKQPALVASGELDPWIKPERGARFADRLKHARFVQISDAARLVPEDRSARLIDLIRDFAVESVPARRPAAASSDTATRNG
jgi:pimeloyl-ACP methyl ester carboxylesterase